MKLSQDFAWYMHKSCKIEEVHTVPNLLLLLRQFLLVALPTENSLLNINHPTYCQSD